jgi:uncharacterized membrane protein
VVPGGPETSAGRNDPVSPEEMATLEGVEPVAAERMIFFSDAVVAIAMTLLALSLPLPHGRTNALIWHSLLHHGDAYLAFMISFLVIAGHWGGHHRLFRYVTGLSGPVASLNMLWLLTMVLVPFAARLLTGGGGFGVRFGIYAGIQVVASLTMLRMATELKHRGLLLPGTPDRVVRTAQVRSGVMGALFAISIPIAFASSLAYLCWIAVPFMFRVAHWVHDHREAQAAAGAGLS